MRISVLFISCLLFFACVHTNVRQQKEVITEESNERATFRADKVSKEVSAMSLEQKIALLLIHKTTNPNAIQTHKAGGYILQNDSPLTHAMRVSTRDSILKPLFFTEASLSLNNHFTGYPTFPNAAAFNSIGNEEQIEYVWDYYLSQLEKTGIDVSLSQAFTPRQLGWDSNVLSYKLDKYLSWARKWKKRSLESRVLVGATKIEEMPPVVVQNPSCPTDFYLNYQYLELFQPPFCVVDSSLITDSTTNLFWTEQLFDYFNYEGLTISTISKKEQIVPFFEGGIDLIIADIAPAILIETVSKAIDNGEIDPWKLDFKVSRVLTMKKKHLKYKKFAVDSAAIQNLFEWEHAADYSNFIHQEATALVSKTKHFPIGPIQNVRLDVLIQGKDSFSQVVDPLSFYLAPRQFGVSTFDKSNKPSGKQLLFIIGEQQTHAMVKDMVEYMNKLDPSAYQISIINFSAPNILRRLNKPANIIQNVAYNQTTISHAIQVLFGGASANGQLVQNINLDLKVGSKHTTKPTVIGFGNPLFKGMNPSKLKKIEATMDKAIAKRAFPGAQVLVVKNNTIVYQKAFGHHTFAKRTAVKNSDLYDIASISKIFATTLATMKLEENGSLNLSTRLKNAMDIPYKTKLGNIRIKELLKHTSGIQPDMPIQEIAWKAKAPKTGCNTYWCRTQNDSTKYQIADNMFIKDSALRSFWKTVHERKPYTNKRYRYSDVNFNLLQKVIESKTKQKLDGYMQDHFYGPMGLRKTLFNPRNRFAVSKIVPTEKDMRFRKQVVHGYVHDESAAIMGGVGGNAGLFSTASDCAKIGQMLLNGGKYGDVRFLESKTIKQYIGHASSSKRGLGFDKPRKTKYPAFSAYAPSSTYGHTGFTGTCVWMDPANKLVYVFLSNRINPSKRNRSFYKLNPRKVIHDIVYQSFEDDLLQLPSIYNVPSEVKEDESLADVTICEQGKKQEPDS